MFPSVKHLRVWAAVLAVCLSVSLAVAQQPANPKRKKKAGKTARQGVRASAVAPGGLIETLASHKSEKLQQDFPAMCLDAEGTPWVAYIAYDGKADTLRLARLTGKGFEDKGAICGSGSLSQPSMARDGAGGVWCVWPQMEGARWQILARRVVGGTPADKAVTIAASKGNELFPCAKADPKGRVWVTWQRFIEGSSDVFAAVLDPKTRKWSQPIQITKDPAGDWEPRLAFAGDETLIIFDSYRRGDFDVYLARVRAGGKVKIAPVAATDRYEARADAAASPDGKTLFVAYEDGIKRWGKDLGSEWRTRGGGLNYDRHIRLVSLDLATGKTTALGDGARLIPGLTPARGPNSSAVNLPQVVVGPAGNPWLLFRYYILTGRPYWQIAVTKYDLAAGGFTQARTLADSMYCHDRRAAVALGGRGALYAVWPSDGRTSKQHLIGGVHVAKVDTGKPVPPAPRAAAEAPGPDLAPPVNATPERPRDQHHVWTVGGEKYTLRWGDFHRHTSLSSCRTPDDGCILENYRYAIDAAGMDYLAPSDHTEAGKVYHEYEWWLNQKLADMFHNPPKFLGFYGYEREQRWPYGHRNVLFTKRGGPMVYIKRKNFAASRWARPLPAEDGVRKGEIPPWQLWDLLKPFGLRVITIAHTSAGPMGTDWSVYKKIDRQIENVLEIYQGSRNSYEAAGAPQPAVATRGGPMNFGKYNAGTYQNALRLGLKLGVFASSDHRSTGISFGGVYVKEFSREGVFDAIDARRTVAGTDKIFMEFTCNGRLLGEIFTTDKKPAMRVAVHGTAPVKVVTILRNETDLKRFVPQAKSSDFAASFTDDEPVDGENRYYVRVEQTDGNMGWTSPVWVTYKRK